MNNMCKFKKYNNMIIYTLGAVQCWVCKKRHKSKTKEIWNKVTVIIC